MAAVTFTEPTLFDVPGPPRSPPSKPLSADRRRTLRQKQSLTNGRHPATGLKLLDGHTCGECTHHVVIEGQRRWHKCEASSLGRSASAASDIRVGWPACLRFEEAD